MTKSTTSSSTSRWLLPRILFFCFLGTMPSPITSEIRTFHGTIDATSAYIHYSEGYIVSPGFVDLSNLVFTTTADDHNDGGRGLDAAAGGDAFGYTVDIVLFHEPTECSNTRKGCDWTELGVGKSDHEGNLRWCCTEEAVSLGMCNGGLKENGRLIVNKPKITERRTVSVPSVGSMKTSIEDGKFNASEGSGKYVLVIANCNDEGRDIMVDGRYTWKSKHGYLPGNLFGEMHFFAILSVFYAVLLFWYGISMKCHENSIIPIQKWILVTIGMGLLETFFKAGDDWVWNEDGTRFWFAMYTGIILGVMKRGISRCLVVMVSLGWGVIRDTLGDQMRKIVLLGVLYVGVSAAREVMRNFAITENQTLSTDEEDELIDAVFILTFVEAAINVLFLMWILDALNGTMQYLENLNQNMKLKRYLRLRCIMLLSILFAIVWAVFGLVNMYMETSILEDHQEWAVDAAWEINYLMVLIGVAVLWRPNPYAKDYAYVMELPAEGEIELQTNVDTIPGPDDDDYDESENNGGFKHDLGSGGYKDEPIDGGFNDDLNSGAFEDDPDGETARDRLKIDDAVDA